MKANPVDCCKIGKTHSSKVSDTNSGRSPNMIGQECHDWNMCINKSMMHWPNIFRYQRSNKHEVHLILIEVLNETLWSWLQIFLAGLRRVTKAPAELKKRKNTFRANEPIRSLLVLYSTLYALIDEGVMLAGWTLSLKDGNKHGKCASWWSRNTFDPQRWSRRKTKHKNQNISANIIMKSIIFPADSLH